MAVPARNSGGPRPVAAPAGFIIDSPWLPRWAGLTILDYFASDELWLTANLRASAEFPELLFLPGFWAEFGMCGEPSAFGAPCHFPPDAFPFARPVIRSVEEIVVAAAGHLGVGVRGALPEGERVEAPGGGVDRRT